MKTKAIIFTLCAAAIGLAILAAQCAATTKKGTRCKRPAAPGSIYCWQHRK